MNCRQIDELIDLVIMEECDPDTHAAVEGHALSCPHCRAELRKAREVNGLLDLHYREEENLANLEERLHRETRPQLQAPARADILRPMLSLAAMLLVTFGLGVWLNSVPDTSGPGPSLDLALGMGPAARMAMVPAPPPTGRKEAAKVLTPQDPIRKATELAVDLEGKSLDAWTTAIEAGSKRGDPPPPPRISLQLVFANPDDEPWNVLFGGDAFSCRLDLTGKRVRRVLVEDGSSPVRRQQVTIPAGGKVMLSWERLVSVEDGQLEYLYPLTMGEYRLQVTVRVRAWRQGEKPRDMWLPSPAPIPLHVGR